MTTSAPKRAADTFVSAILYASFDERANVLASIPNIHSELAESFSSYEIILVNDSAQLLPHDDLDRLRTASVRNLVLLDLAFSHGREKAMTAAADLSVGDFIIEFDYTVLRLESGLLRWLYERSGETGADIMACAPIKARRWGSRLFYYLLRKLGVTAESMVTESVRIVSRRAQNRVLRERRNFRYRKLLYLLSGFQYRVERSDKIEVARDRRKPARIRLAFDVLTSITRLGSSVAVVLALSFIVISMLLGVYSVAVRLLGFPVSEGWTTIMLFLSIGFSGLFLVLSLVARTLELVLQEVQAADPYTVRRILRLENQI